MYKILIVEDDATIAAIVKKHIESWGYEARIADDLKNVTGCFEKYLPHLILMDISLTYQNGFYWCGEIRKISTCPVIFISSYSDNMSIVTAVNMGGDDYIQKPFDLNVLMAKINALLRRSYDFKAPLMHLTARGATLFAEKAVLEYEGKKLSLTKNELIILTLLMKNKGKVIKRDELMKDLWETDSFIDDNTLTVNINRLRKHLEDIGLKDFIITKKGLGYMVE